MKLFAILAPVLVVASLPSCLTAQNKLTAAEMRELAKENDAKQEELINLELETARARQWNNGALFRRIYSEDFVGISPSGQVRDKAGFISSIENSGIRYTSFIASDIHIRLYQDIAVVTCMWSIRGSQGEKEISKQYRVTHVYVYGQRGWQAVSSQETILPG